MSVSSSSPGTMISPALSWTLAARSSLVPSDRSAAQTPSTGTAPRALARYRIEYESPEGDPLRAPTGCG